MKWLIAKYTDDFPEEGGGTEIQTVDYSRGIEEVTAIINREMQENTTFEVFLVNYEYEVVPKEIIKTIELKVKNES